MLLPFAVLLVVEIVFGATNPRVGGLQVPLLLQCLQRGLRSTAAAIDPWTPFVGNRKSWLRAVASLVSNKVGRGA